MNPKIQFVKNKYNLKYDFCAERLLSIKEEYDKLKRGSPEDSQIEDQLSLLGAEAEEISAGTVCRAIDEVIEKHHLKSIDTAVTLYEVQQQIHSLKVKIKSESDKETRMRLFAEIADFLSFEKAIIESEMIGGLHA